DRQSPSLVSGRGGGERPEGDLKGVLTISTVDNCQCEFPRDGARRQHPLLCSALEVLTCSGDVDDLCRGDAERSLCTLSKTRDLQCRRSPYSTTGLIFRSGWRWSPARAAASVPRSRTASRKQEQRWPSLIAMAKPPRM